jgi:hypothetical protein
MYSALMPEYDQAHRGRASGARDAGETATFGALLALPTVFRATFVVLAVAGDGRRTTVRARGERFLVLMRGFCLPRCGFCVLFAVGAARV